MKQHGQVTGSEVQLAEAVSSESTPPQSLGGITWQEELRNQDEGVYTSKTHPARHGGGAAAQLAGHHQLHEMTGWSRGGKQG